MLLAENMWFETGTRYGLEIKHQCGKRFKNISQKVFGTSFYVCRNYKGKTCRGPYWLTIVNRFGERFRNLAKDVCQK